MAESLSGAAPGSPEVAALSAGLFASAAGEVVSDALAAGAEVVWAGFVFGLPVVEGEFGAGCVGCAVAWAGAATGAEAD